MVINMRKAIEFNEFRDISKAILSDFKKYCEKNDLKYFLTYGTLLGAVRHQDMIPWDYDIDVYMPRPDFIKFVNDTAVNPINDHLKVFSYRTVRNYYLVPIKICDSRTRLVITKSTSKLPLGVWIDVFPLDAIPEEKEEIKILRGKYGAGQLNALLPSRKCYNNKEKLYKFFRSIPILFHGQSRYLEEISELGAENDFYSAKTVGPLSYKDKSEKEFVPYSCYEKSIMLKFGKEEFSCPCDYDTVLKSQYGNDYMQLPPEKDRVTPDIEAYWIE